MIARFSVSKMVAWPTSAKCCSRTAFSFPKVLQPNSAFFSKSAAAEQHFPHQKVLQLNSIFLTKKCCSWTALSFQKKRCSAAALFGEENAVQLQHFWKRKCCSAAALLEKKMPFGCSTFGINPGWFMEGYIHSSFTMCLMGKLMGSFRSILKLTHWANWDQIDGQVLNVITTYSLG